MKTASVLQRAAALSAALTILVSAPALAAAARDSETTPVDLGTSTSPSGDVGGGGGSLVRTIVGLAVVIGVIYGIAWVLRQVKQSKQEQATGGLASVASAPLGAGRSVHLVRAGSELLLVGVADHGVTPLRTYTEEEAQEAGLIDEWGELILPEAGLEPVAVGARGGAKRPNAANVVESIRKWTVRR